jgi:hypothetical protein
MRRFVASEMIAQNLDESLHIRRGQPGYLLDDNGDRINCRFRIVSDSGATAGATAGTS